MQYGWLLAIIHYRFIASYDTNRRTVIILLSFVTECSISCVSLSLSLSLSEYRLDLIPLLYCNLVFTVGRRRHTQVPAIKTVL